MKHQLGSRTSVPELPTPESGSATLPRPLPPAEVGTTKAGVLGTTKEVLGFIIDFLDFNLDFLGFPIILLGFPRISIRILSGF